MGYVYTKFALPPADGAAFMFTLLTFMTANGFVVTSSGDGVSTYSSTGSVFIFAGSGAGGMNNPAAWFVLKYPNSNREILFSADYIPNIVWAILYSYTGGFSGGGIATAPTTSDQQFFCGYSTSTFGGGTLFSSTNTTDVVMMVQDEAPYVWACFGKDQLQTDLINFLLLGDCCQSLTACPGDPDPYVFFAPNYQDFGSLIVRSTSGGDMLTVSSDAIPAIRFRNYAWSGIGTANAQWRAFSCSPFAGYYGGTEFLVSDGGMDVNPFTGKDQLALVSYAGAYGPESVPYAGLAGFTDNPQWKGVSTLWLYVLPKRPVGDTFNVVSSKDYLSLGGMAVPWDGTDSPFSTP